MGLIQPAMIYSCFLTESLLLFSVVEDGVGARYDMSGDDAKSVVLACLQLGPDNEGQYRLREIKSKDDAWDDLELPDGHKHIVQSLIQSHFAKDKSQKIDFDIVRDKGTTYLEPDFGCH